MTNLRKILFMLLLFFTSSSLFTSNVFGLEEICDWNIQKIDSANVINPNQQFQKNFLDFENYQSDSIKIDCPLDEPINLKNKLISFDFFINSESNPDLVFSLIDDQGQKKSSKPIFDWYDISLNQGAHIVLDPLDFKIHKEFSDEDSINFQLEIIKNNIGTLEISNPKILTIEEHQNFAINENLPVQYTFPAFLLLILISFPAGFLILNWSGFLKDENFIVKLPWFLGFGFIIIIITNYLIGLFWLSLATVLIVPIVGWLILLIYKIKNKNHKLKLESKTVFVFFSAVLIFSAVLFSYYSDTVGWPRTTGDAQRHAYRTALILYDEGLPTYEEVFPSPLLNFQRDRASYFPYSDIPGSFVAYPLGTHSTTAALSLLSGSVPAISLEAVFSFVVFLIPAMFASLVYRFTKSIFYALIIVMIIFWQISPGNLFGDMIFGQWVRGNFASEVGMIAMLTTFAMLISHYEIKNKLSLIPIVLSLLGLGLIYYPFLALPVVISGIVLLVTHLTNKKILLPVFSFLTAIFILMPLWSVSALKKLGTNQQLLYAHYKYANLHLPSGSFSVLLPYWISVFGSLITSSILLMDKKYRVLSIILLPLAVVHILALSEDLAFDYTFFHKSLRDTGLLFFLSISVNLIFINYLTINFGKFSKFSTKKTLVGKIGIISVLFLVLLPGYFILDDRVRPSFNELASIPSGNEKNLQFWLYENTKPEDLILNDISKASTWYLGFKAQPLINGEMQSMSIANSFNEKSGTYKPQYDGSILTLKANEILRHPWNYEMITETLEELGIDYLYISERQDFIERCKKWKTGSPSCYPTSINWPWHDYSGSSRIAMYENHPNLELILRNGDSAIFKVMS